MLAGPIHRKKIISKKQNRAKEGSKKGEGYIYI
jgi:hypothetical protein